MKQTTLFDMTPYETDTRPLIRCRDDVWQVSMRAQIDGRTGECRIAVEVSQALTEELAYWHLSETAVTEGDVQALIDRAYQRYLGMMNDYRCPF